MQPRTVSCSVQRKQNSTGIKYIKTPSINQKADALTKLMTRSEHERATSSFQVDINVKNQ